MTEKEFDETTLWTPANIVTLFVFLLVPCLCRSDYFPMADLYTGLA